MTGVHMPDQESYEQQLQILKAYRRTLAHLLEQAANHGGITYSPPQVANGIQEAREQIASTKLAIRGWGYTVDDNPMDAESIDVPAPQPVQIKTTSTQPKWRIVKVIFVLIISTYIGLLISGTLLESGSIGEMTYLLFIIILSAVLSSVFIFILHRRNII